jgi:hypothetical protein
VTAHAQYVHTVYIQSALQPHVAPYVHIWETGKDHDAQNRRTSVPPHPREERTHAPGGRGGGRTIVVVPKGVCRAGGRVSPRTRFLPSGQAQGTATIRTFQCNKGHTVRRNGGKQGEAWQGASSEQGVGLASSARTVCNSDKVTLTEEVLLVPVPR